MNKIVFVIGTHIICDNKEIEEVKGKISIIYFKKIDLSYEYAKQLANKTDVIFFSSIEKVLKESGNFSLGNYTVNIKGKTVEVGSFASEELLSLEHGIKIGNIFSSELNINVLLNNIYHNKFILLGTVSILFLLLVKDYWLFKIDLQEREKLVFHLFPKEFF